MSTSIISYNLNGIRSAVNKGVTDWLRTVDCDIFCVQETKAHIMDIPVLPFEELGYTMYAHSAEKKGYSGVATFTKRKPDYIEIGCGLNHYDTEGRVLRTDFGDTTLLNCYFPSGTSGDERQGFKMEFLREFYDWVQELRKTRPNLIIVGDYNIAHQEIDIHNPKQNANTSGFLPVEREWLGNFIDSGFIDSFRHLNKEPHNYSWWSYRANARNNNKGSRIDYCLATESLKDKVQRALILPEAKHSDHCPVYVEIE